MADEVIFQSSAHLNWTLTDRGADSAAAAVSTPPQQIDQCVMERRAGTDVDLIAYGFIYPILTIVIIFTNVNGIVVLLRMRNFTQTNMLLLAIFIVDLLTTVIPFPKFFLQFTINLNKPDIPKYPWCFLSSLLFPALPVITNNISIWFVVVLTIQRFTCVWKRDTYNRVFSRSNVIIVIGAITLVTTLFHSVLLIDNYRRPLGCPSGSEHPEVFICNEDPKTYIIPGGTDVELYVLSSYYLSRIFIFHFIPILAIAVSNLLLIQILLKAEGTRRKLFTNQRQQHPELIKIDEDEGTGAAATICRKILRPTTTNLTADSNLLLANGVDSRHFSSVHSGPANLKDILQTRRRTRTSTVKSGESGPNKAQRMSTTTHMLMAISTIYLVQHIFQTILFVSGVALNVIGEREPPMLIRAITIQNLVYWAGFTANFFLCLHVQTQFREVFFSMYRNCKVVEVVGNVFHRIRLAVFKSQADTAADLQSPSQNMTNLTSLAFTVGDSPSSQPLRHDTRPLLLTISESTKMVSSTSLATTVAKTEIAKVPLDEADEEENPAQTENSIEHQSGTAVSTDQDK